MYYYYAYQTNVLLLCSSNKYIILTITTHESQKPSGYLIWRIEFPGTKFPPFSTAKYIDGSEGWGTNKMFDAADMVTASLDFKIKRNREVVYVPPDSAPYYPFVLSGIATIRTVSAEEWALRKDDMTKSPNAYLYLSTTKSNHYPDERPMLTHEARMRNMLSGVSEADNGVYTLIVGSGEVRFEVHANVLNSLVTDVRILNRMFTEGKNRTVRLPDDDPDTIRVFIQFVYTLEVADHDMEKYAAGLLQLTDKFFVRMLHYLCEWYLCWKVQVCGIDFACLKTQLTPLHPRTRLPTRTSCQSWRRLSIPTPWLSRRRASKPSLISANASSQTPHSTSCQGSSRSKCSEISQPVARTICPA